MRSLTFPFLAAVTISGAALLPWTTSARAESHDATTVALGWQTENADVIVVGGIASDASAPAPAEPVSGREVEFRVDESLKGDVASGQTIRIRSDDHGCAAAWRPGVPHLVFLRRSEAATSAATDYLPISGAFSVRAIEPGSIEARFPALVTSLREALGSTDPHALTSLLVSWMDDSDPGIAWSAATDFTRHTELQASLSEAEAAKIVAAFRRQPIGKNTKGALALAVAATRSPEAVPALVDSLLLPNAGRIRGSVAEGLRRLDSSAAETDLAAKLADAKPAQRTALLGALGVVGGVVAVPSVTPLLRDDDAAVRLEAAAALGGMARNARARDPEARLGVAALLEARLEGPSADQLPENEARAVLWALAQLDEPGAFDAVRHAAAKFPRPETRDWAARLLARPRQSLVLRD